MKIRHLLIKNFRGIKELNWQIKTDFVCLVGPCDSSKTTILDAIESVLSPAWNLHFEDTDFYCLKVEDDIYIEVTVDDLPAELLSDHRFGLFLRGWNEKEGLVDEPMDGFLPVLTIALRVKKDLEPEWLIVNERLTEEKRIGAKDRSLLGMSRLGGGVSKHLCWGAGSVLNKLLDASTDFQTVLSDAGREIRKNINFKDVEHLVSSVKKITELGAKFGVIPKNEMRAHLDIKHIGLKESAISLHDGDVPLRLSGIGTQRLLAIALQLAAVEEGGIGLIDEIEYGLEPHRIYQLLRILMSTKGQIFITTHSPSVIAELKVVNIHTLNSELDGTANMQNFKDVGADSIQRIARAAPQAFLVKRVIVCEGKTEQGFLRGVDQKEEVTNNRGMWSYGVMSVDGNGASSVEVAKLFKSFKYDVTWFGDSDVGEINNKKQELKDLGISIFDWSDSANLETRVFKDLPWNGIKKLIAQAMEVFGTESIRDQIKSRVPSLSNNYEEWLDTESLRVVLANVSKDNKWFKSISGGEEIGKIAYEYLPQISSSNLNLKINEMLTWIKANG